MKGIVLLIIVVLASVTALGFFVPPTHGIIWIEGHITSDATWTPVDTYHVINDTYVDPGVTLTIEPGVRVQFADGFSLIVEGNLIAVGTNVDPITFTSSRSSPSPGVWNTIKFKGNSSGQFLVKHVEVEYAVHGVTVESSRSAIIENSEIHNCSENGIMLVGKSNVVIERNTIKLNRNGISTDNSSTHSGIIVMNNSICSNQEDGIYIKSSDSNAYIYNITVSNNNVSSNGKAGIHAYSHAESYLRRDHVKGFIYNVTFSGNTISSNGESGIDLYSSGESWGYKSTSKGFIYNVAFSGNNVLSNGAHGIRLFSMGGGGSAFAYIYNVTFSGNNVSSNSVHGIHLFSVGAGGGAFGYIYNVAFSGNIISSNVGGIDLLSFGAYGYIYNVTVSGNRLLSNRVSGIRAEAPDHYGVLPLDLSILQNIISANYVGSEISGEIIAKMVNNSISYNVYGVQYSETTKNHANYNDIYCNSYGMNVTNGATVNAEYNYWGHSTGPYHPSLNPEGNGNPVNGDGIDLDFLPFNETSFGPINERPTALLLADKETVNVNETIAFDASASTDDGEIIYYFFDFGDGTNSGWASLPAVTHKYSEEGEYNVTLIVMDNFGVTSLDGDLVFVEITVVPEFPRALILPLFMILSMLAIFFTKKRFPTKHKL